MPKIAFYNQIVKPGMTRVEMSNKAQSDAVSDAVASLNLSLPNGQVDELKTSENTISLSPGEFGRLTLSTPDAQVSSVGTGAKFRRGLTASQSGSLSGVRFDCDGDRFAVSVFGFSKVVLVGCKITRTAKGGGSRHVLLDSGSIVFVACEFVGALGDQDKILTKGTPGGTAVAIGCRFPIGADVSDFDVNLGAI